LLEVTDLNVYYGAIHALQGVSFRVEEGEIVTLIGANGAGKSTTLRTVSGLLHPRSGSVRLKGQDITMVSAEKIVRMGISHVPEGRKIFAPLTVRENLLMGAYRRKDWAGIQRDLEWVCELFPILKERQGQRAGSLSGGEQQMCAIARGLMARPKILIVDELSLGLAPIILDILVDTIQKIHREGTTIFVVEQDVATAFDVATTGYVLENGQIVLSGPTTELKANPHVKKAYLGL
jgi:branched-chain amino acid transport system ATP-binding protein